MTLRARLAAAFAVTVLGPVLFAGALLAGALARPGPSVAEVRVAHATAAVRAAVAVHCQRLDATARALAVLAATRGDRHRVEPVGVPGPWAQCHLGAGPVPVPAVAGGPLRYGGLAAGAVAGGAPRYGGLAAGAEIRVNATVTGHAYAVQPIDGAFLRELSAAAGATVSLGAAGAVSLGAAGAAVGDSAAGVTSRLEPDVDQPLPLSMSMVPPPPADAVPTAIAVALTAGAVTGGLGWWLAGVATRPLRALLAAVERAIAGDLEASSGIRGRDETGRLGGGLDRLIAETHQTRLLSVTDALTGLGNVRHLWEALRLEVERASRFGRTLGVLVLDLDHFKAVNDRFGHRAGDAVLVEVARRVLGIVREVDRAFRQGGEEFVILLPETDVQGSLTAARRIRDAVRERPFAVADRAAADGDARAVFIPVTVSIGVAVFPRHAAAPVDVLDAADDALYAAKNAGRDRYVLAGVALAAQRSPHVAETGGASGGTTSPRTSHGG